MNISSVSFMGTTNRTNRSSAPRPRTNNHNDEFISTQRKIRTNSKKKKKHISLPGLLTTGAGTVLALSLAFNGTTMPKTPVNEATEVFFDGSHAALTRIADEYNCDYEFLLDYNNLSEYSSLEDIDSVQVPATYDYMQNAIDFVESQLEKDNLKEEKREELETRLSGLKAKKAAQDEIGKIYSDGEFLYIDINAPEEYEDKYEFGINVEVFKDLFDIKNGEISEYNDLSYTFESGPDGVGAYKDYTNNWLRDGEVIKIKPSSINSKIDIDKYI